MIQIQHLTKRFAAAGATVVALNDINLEIQNGDIYGIIGMSGAGKSTLVRCINMLERPDEGKVIVNGREMMQLSPAELRDARREITMIFQQFNLLMQRTCLRNIMFPMELAKVPKEKAEARARELLELVGLPDKAEAYPAQLSGGQKQRIAIARFICKTPVSAQKTECRSTLLCLSSVGHDRQPEFVSSSLIDLLLLKHLLVEVLKPDHFCHPFFRSLCTLHENSPFWAF